MRTTIASFRIVPLFGVIALVVAASAAAQDWSGFRGANGGGRVTGWPEEMSDPKGWPESLERGWRIPVGLGHASPVVQGDTGLRLLPRGRRRGSARTPGGER